MIGIKDLFDLEHSIAAELFSGLSYPHEALGEIGNFILRLGPTLSSDVFSEIAPQIWVAKGVSIPPTATLIAPIIIDQGAEIRPGAYIRGQVIVGKGAVVGNSSELKNCLLFDGVQAPHYNYIGDSILGYKAHFGAGAITSNVKGDKSEVVIKAIGQEIKTGRKKVGAMAGDFAEIGCNSVLNPGTIIGRHGRVYPLCSVRGHVPEGYLYKGPGQLLPQHGKAR